ncbi:hypothetical protein APHAL10511_008244 [Amanita phalloides]|nr:hypothetical protein APHAL10511_008244 [Amanita phalloides]
MFSPLIGSIVQTATLGNTTGGTPFNDLDTLRQTYKLPLSLVVDPDRPITKIVVRAGGLIDAIEITYNLAGGGTHVLKHGGNNGSQSNIDIGPDQVISSISGLIGPHRNYDNRVFLNQISFTLLDATTGVTTVRSFGQRPQGNPFLFTLPVLFTGCVGVADSNTTGICALGVIKRGEF